MPLLMHCKYFCWNWWEFGKHRVTVAYFYTVHTNCTTCLGFGLCRLLWRHWLQDKFALLFGRVHLSSTLLWEFHRLWSLEFKDWWLLTAGHGGSRSTMHMDPGAINLLMMRCLVEAGAGPSCWLSSLLVCPRTLWKGPGGPVSRLMKCKSM